MIGDDDVCYAAVRACYGDARAQRSGVSLIAHVDDGLRILDALSASTIAQQAFCLHPLVQADADLAAAFDVENTGPGALHSLGVPARALAVALEYRRCANAHLSTHEPSTLASLSLAPFSPELRHMLIADKVQNRRDFERHHRGTHARSDVLSAYFERWLRFLDVDEDQYARLITVIGGR